MQSPGRQLDGQWDPLDVLRGWPADVPVMMLHSGRPDPRWARWSLLAPPEGRYRFTLDETGQGRSQWLGDDESPAGLAARAFTHDPLADLRRLLAADAGPWIGHLSYDLGRWIERLPTRARDDRQWPIIDLARADGWLECDAITGHWRACGAWANPDHPAAVRFDPARLHAAARSHDPLQLGPAVADFSRDAYEAAVQRVIDYIAAGDAFQVNLTQRFAAPLAGGDRPAMRQLYRRLAEVSPAWYGAYIESPADEQEQPERVIASTSPELFLELADDGAVVTRPIKGTRPANVDAGELARSEKDQAELHMITDLLRNDLGRVCAYGSMRVIEPRRIESHPTVHHGVATISGRLRTGCDVVDLLAATMPGGSITGAPKVRAMEIIEELEPVRRGPYCGAIGVIHGRKAWFNIAIRTLLATYHQSGEGWLDYNVGGGVVADSLPAAEYDETIAKAQAMRLAMESSVGQASPAATG